MAIGYDTLRSQRGSSIAGSRCARSRTIIQLALPAPMIIAARSSIASTLPWRRISPVRARLSRWRDAPCAGITPPR